MASSATSVELVSFGGLNQSGDGYNMSLRYATDMSNVDVTGGSFAPMQKGVPIKQRLGTPIGTLACLHRRFGVDENEHNVLVAFTNGQVLTKILDGDDGWVSRYHGLSTDHVDYVTYEINNGNDTIDVLLFTNAADGMFCLYGDDLHVDPVETPYSFGVLERHQERIWGSAIKDFPDLLVYSAPFNPFDWAQNNEIPEDGAGEVLQPSWDGDSFLALRSFGSQLLAFKKHGIWRILGTDPGTYTIKEQYGGGSIEENTICVGVDTVTMLGYGGLMRYDGAVTEPFQQDATCRLLRERLNRNAIHQACAVMKDTKNYMIAVPLDGSPVNNAVIAYDSTHTAFTLREDISVGTFLRVDDRVFYTSGKAPGMVFELNDQGDVLPCWWWGGYQDLGLKSSVKSAFIVYLTAEAEAPFDLVIGIRTERKAKYKVVRVIPGKPVRKIINAQGRFFRLELASDSSVPFKLTGGVKIDLELDPD